MEIQNETEKLIQKILHHYKIETIVQLASIFNISHSTISGWRKRNAIEAIKQKCIENQIYDEIFDEKKNELMQDLISDFQNLIGQDEFIKFLKDNIADNVIDKIIDNEKTNNLFVKLLDLTGPNRPTLFLYYICQFVQKNMKKDITNYRDFLIDVISKFPIHNIIINQPIFTQKIKNEFIEIIKNKMSEEECTIVVNNSNIILEKLEEKMPVYIVQAHRNRFK